MRRETTRYPKRQITEVEALVEDGEFPNKSEVYRQALREFLQSRGVRTSTPGYLVADGGHNDGR